MPLKLIPPGKRKGNRTYLVRGTVAGQRVESSTGTADRIHAKDFARKLERRLIAESHPNPVKTFAEAADAYIAAVQPPARQEAHVLALKAYFGRRELAPIRQADLVAAANILCPTVSNESKNRKVLGPGAAVLHYAAEQEWCSYRRIRLLPTKAPVTRAAPEGDMDDAMRRAKAAKDNDLILLLLWLREHGTRITDTLRVRGEHINLARGTYSFHVSKTDTPREKALADPVWAILASRGVRDGPLFPYANRWAVYRALKAIGAKVRPHAMRHALGRALNDSGAGLKTIMETFDHKSERSSMRYQSADVEIVRQGLRKVGENRGKRRKSA